MTKCIVEANLEGQGWYITLFTILLVLTWGWHISEREETSEKGCVEIKDWGTSVQFVLGFQENSLQNLFAFLLFFGSNGKNSKSPIFSHSFYYWIPLIFQAMAQIRGKDTH